MLVELQNKEFMHATVREDAKKCVKKARNEKGQTLAFKAKGLPLAAKGVTSKLTSRAGGATVRRHMHQAKIKAAIATQNEENPSLLFCSTYNVSGKSKQRLRKMTNLLWRF